MFHPTITFFVSHEKYPSLVEIAVCFSVCLRLSVVHSLSLLSRVSQFRSQASFRPCFLSPRIPPLASPSPSWSSSPPSYRAAACCQCVNTLTGRCALSLPLARQFLPSPLLCLPLLSQNPPSYTHPAPLFAPLSLQLCLLSENVKRHVLQTLSHCSLLAHCEDHLILAQTRTCTCTHTHTCTLTLHKYVHLSRHILVD